MSTDASPVQRIEIVLKEKHLQKKMLADSIGIPPTTLSSWLGRGNDFPASYVVPVARFLGVHPMWLLTGEEAALPEIPVSYVELSNDESFLLQSYRTLDQEGKIVVANKAVEELRRAKAVQGKTASSTQTA